MARLVVSDPERPVDRQDCVAHRHESDRRELARQQSGQPVRLADLVVRTKLSNTQALCALDVMVRNGDVSKASGSNTFSWVGPATPDQRKTTNPDAHKASRSTMNDSGKIAEK